MVKNEPQATLIEPAQGKVLKNTSLSGYLESATAVDSHLPLLPPPAMILDIRKGLRKKPIPNVFLLPDEWDYPGVGSYQKAEKNAATVFIWQREDEGRKEFYFDELCTEKSREQDRLELGWMIADFAKIDRLKYLSEMRPASYEDRHQHQFNREYVRQKKHFEKLEIAWRHWAIVSAGHMLL
jgi:hypothetical protein